MSLDILVVDDEEDIRDLISDILEDEGYQVRVAKNSREALDEVAVRVPSAVILDIWLQGSDLDGLGVLESVKEKHANVPIIMISGHGNVETAISSIRMGAYDYIEKPFKEDKLLLTLQRAVESAQLKRENAELRSVSQLEAHLIGDSSAVKQLRNEIEQVASSSSRVMIVGEPGSGKEAVARLIHEQSPRKRGPFVILNAASLSSEYLEEEMFGREDDKGIRKVGFFEQAHRGTLFIDEIADMPLPVQGKLLRCLQQQTFKRMGGSQDVTIDVRVVSSTNRDIQALIDLELFREDLYYRLNVVMIRIPSLQKRHEDVEALIEYFMGQCSKGLNVPSRPISSKAMHVLKAYTWPGNVRQLRNVIEWLLIMKTKSKEIQVDDLPPEITSPDVMIERPENNADLLSLPLKAAREVFERQYLTAQVRRFGGNVSKTAEFVGMERSAFHRKIKQLGIVTGEEKSS